VSDGYVTTSTGGDFKPGDRLRITVPGARERFILVVAVEDGGCTLTTWPATFWNRVRLPVVLRWRALRSLRFRVRGRLS
jgi:hypothetical protein